MAIWRSHVVACMTEARHRDRRFRTRRFENSLMRRSPPAVETWVQVGETLEYSPELTMAINYSDRIVRVRGLRAAKPSSAARG
jgi:hypothetical protein